MIKQAYRNDKANTSCKRNIMTIKNNNVNDFSTHCLLKQYQGC